MTAVRFGVVGTGTMGERHTRVASNLARVELVGVTDPDETAGRRVADAYETSYFGELDDLLGKVDAVSIAASTPAHHALAARCLEAGAHVLVEKPLAESVEAARDLVERARRAGRILAVGHIERFNPAFTELAGVVSELTVVGISVRRLSPRDTSNTDVDVIRDLMIHDLDLVTALVDAPLEGVTAWGRVVDGASLDYVVATLSFAGGPVATLFASRVTEEKVRDVEAVADGAYVQADLLTKSVHVHRRTFDRYQGHTTAPAYRQEALTERIHVPTAEPLMLEIRDFAQAVRDHRSPRVTGEDGLRALELAETVAAAARSATGVVGR